MSQSKLVPLEQEDIEVLRESIWHAVARKDLPGDDRARLYRLSDQLRNYIAEESEVNDAQRIEDAGGIIDIGPECFGLCDGSVLSWRGENYVPQKPSLHVRLRNAWVGLLNRRR